MNLRIGDLRCRLVRVALSNMRLLPFLAHPDTIRVAEESAVGTPWQMRSNLGKSGQSVLYTNAPANT